MYFGTFSAAFFSFFQVVTTDSWASGITRALFPDDGTVDKTVLYTSVPQGFSEGMVFEMPGAYGTRTSITVEPGQVAGDIIKISCSGEDGEHM